MQTVMSIALARVGLVTEEQASNVDCVPYHLKPYEQQIEEISRLAGLLAANGVKQSGEDVIACLSFRLDLQQKQYAKAYSLMVEHLSQRVTQLGL